MRTLTLSLALFAAFLCVRPAPLKADEEDGEVARLERRVEMLIDLVAELRDQVLALEARVAELEASPGTPKVERVPATPLVPVPVVVWPQIGGVYTLDKEASTEAILKAQLEGVEDEETAEVIRRGVESEFASVSLTLRIENDGTFFVRLEGPDPEDDNTTARGTWTRDETVIGTHQRLIFVTTHEDGVEEADPKELVGTWEDGRLVLREGEEDTDDYVMIFHRK